MADITDTVWHEVDSANTSAGTLPGWPEGQNPSTVNDSARAMQGAIRRWYDRSNPTHTSTGSANAQVLTYTVGPAAYVLGDVYSFIAGFTNSGATSLNVNSLGAANILTRSDALSGGEIVAGSVSVVAFDGTNFQLLNPGGHIVGNLNVTGAAAISGAITGASISTTGNASFGGNATVGGNETITGDLTVNDIAASGNAAITGDITTNDITASGAISGATLATSGNAAIGGTLAVTGASTLTGNTTVAGTLTASNGLSITGTLNLGGTPITILTGDATFYISTTGNDSTGDGSLATPWATLVHAYNDIVAKTTFGEHTVNLLIEPGTYTWGTTAFSPTVGNWNVSSSTNIATDVVINVTGLQHDGFHVFGTGNLTVQYLTVAAAQGYAMASHGASQLTAVGVNVGTSLAHFIAYDGGNVAIRANYIIVGNADTHYQADHGSLTASEGSIPIVVASSGAVTFAFAFGVAANTGFLRAVGGSYSGITATGKRYIAETNGVINTNGESDLTFFPGTIAGSQVTGGIWA